MADDSGESKIRAGSVDAVKDLNPSQFPFDAFEHEDPSGTAPKITVVSPWILNGKIRARYAP